MNIKEYDKLRRKINVKDFEGKNKGLDKWLYNFSFIGNIGSIFFAYFLVYPSLLKGISLNLVDGFWGSILSFTFTCLFLIIFEIIKRYLIKNFSLDFVQNNKKLKPSILGWLTISISIVLLSFFLSVTGSKNLATTSISKNNIVETKLNTYKDSLSIVYENKKKIYENDNNSLRTVNNSLRDKLTNTDVKYRVIRNDYQTNINTNTVIIDKNQIEIKNIDDQLKQRIEELKSNIIDKKKNNTKEDVGNITIFIIISMFCEIIIMVGIYNRENYENTLLNINKQKFEKIYLQKDRYKALLAYIYNNGKANIGDKVISGIALKELIKEKTNLINGNKIIEDFLSETTRLGIFNVVGKKRYIQLNYNEAIDIIDNFDDSLRILENIK